MLPYCPSTPVIGWAAKNRFLNESGSCQSPNPMPVLFHPLVKPRPREQPEIQGVSSWCVELEARAQGFAVLNLVRRDQSRAGVDESISRVQRRVLQIDPAR